MQTQELVDLDFTKPPIPERKSAQEAVVRAELEIGSVCAGQAGNFVCFLAANARRVVAAAVTRLAFAARKQTKFPACPAHTLPISSSARTTAS